MQEQLRAKKDRQGKREETWDVYKKVQRTKLHPPTIWFVEVGTIGRD